MAPPFIVLPVIPREIVPSGPLVVAGLVTLLLKIDVAAVLDSEDLNRGLPAREVLVVLPRVLVVGSTARTVWVRGSTK